MEDEIHPKNMYLKTYYKLLIFQISIFINTYHKWLQVYNFGPRERKMDYKIEIRCNLLQEERF